MLFTADKKYIIKTIALAEVDALVKMLPEYHEVRFYYRVKYSLKKLFMKALTSYTAINVDAIFRTVVVGSW